MSQIAKYIDHTILKADALLCDIDRLCEEAAQHHFASVCVNPTHVAYCAEKLKGTDVKVCTVIGFPLGASTSKTKAFEAEDAIENGALEIDMVINIGALKDGNKALVLNDIKGVVAKAEGKALVKVIIETCLLTEQEKITACRLAKEANAGFVKTSTGFSTGGATASDIALMRKTVGDNICVKASGGVRDYESAMLMIENGATRIGASAGVSIVNAEKAAELQRN